MEILIVDDDSMNRTILREYLEAAGYMVDESIDGEDCWMRLLDAPDRFHAVLLDLKLPRTSGMDVLRRIKNHPWMKPMPVIIQTGDANVETVRTGLREGAYYYLVKPFDRQMLLSVVRTAAADYEAYRQMRGRVAEAHDGLAKMVEGTFEFRNLDEARMLGAQLAHTCSDPGRVVIGLTELLINAIEHGNLEIGYVGKSELLMQGEWENEVARRLAQKKFADRVASISYRRESDSLYFLIEDQGPGFDWVPYLEVTPERVFDAHGRGIAIARTVSFDQLQYLGSGNRLQAVVKV